MKVSLLCLFTLVAVVISGIMVVRNAHQVRMNHVALEATAKSYNALLDQKTRLLLERGAHASLGHIEQVAGEELSMQFPNAGSTSSDRAAASLANGADNTFDAGGRR